MDRPDVTLQLSRLGFGRNFLVRVDVEIELKNSSRRGIVLNQPSFGLNRAFLVKGAEVLREQRFLMVRQGVLTIILVSQVSLVSLVIFGLFLLFRGEGGARAMR